MSRCLPIVLLAALGACGDDAGPSSTGGPDGSALDAAVPTDSSTSRLDAEPMLGDATIVPEREAGAGDADILDDAAFLPDSGVVSSDAGLLEDGAIGALPDGDVPPAACGEGTPCPPGQRCCPTMICLPSTLPCP